VQQITHRVRVVRGANDNKNKIIGKKYKLKLTECSFGADDVHDDKKNIDIASKESIPRSSESHWNVGGGSDDGWDEYRLLGELLSEDLWCLTASKRHYCDDVWERLKSPLCH
jgi:hypothetical protein